MLAGQLEGPQRQQPDATSPLGMQGAEEVDAT